MKMIILATLLIGIGACEMKKTEVVVVPVDASEATVVDAGVADAG